MRCARNPGVFHVYRESCTPSSANFALLHVHRLGTWNAATAQEALTASNVVAIRRPGRNVSGAIDDVLVRCLIVL